MIGKIFLVQTQSWQSFIIYKICYFIEKYAGDIFYATVSSYYLAKNSKSGDVALRVLNPRGQDHGCPGAPAPTSGAGN